ncbi:MAG TPA: AAA family ATPase [Firmicutes bacterium]|nr:AAA family ATPase [Bacillota bacterium]
MRILELEIWKVRGVKHLLIAPEGKNFLIYGPNGTGKSAVVDALDFLLTGQISRLSGKGTRGILIKSHGPYLDYGPADAAVRAVIRLPGEQKPVTITRCMASPSTLEYDDYALAPQLEKILSLARRGQYVLTRKDLLNYIAAEAGTKGPTDPGTVEYNRSGKNPQVIWQRKKGYSKKT